MKQPSLKLALALALSAGAASAADVVILKSSDVPAWRPAVEALRRGAANHNIAEFDLLGDRAEAERVLAQITGKGTILVAFGPLAARAAREKAPDRPLIFCMVQDPASLGLPDAPNTWGVAFVLPARTQLAAFRLVNPRGVRIGVIHTADAARLVGDAQQAARTLHLLVLDRSVTSEKDVPEALRSLLKEGMDALWIPPDPLLVSDATRRYLLAETLKAGKPVYSFSSALVPEGALASNGPDVASIGDRAAEIVNRLAGGEKGQYELAFPFAELVINKKIADQLKLPVPADALKAAKRVF